jgi:hypothetical protein
MIKTRKFNGMDKATATPYNCSKYETCINRNLLICDPSLIKDGICKNYVFGQNWEPNNIPDRLLRKSGEPFNLSGILFLLGTIIFLILSFILLAPIYLMDNLFKNKMQCSDFGWVRWIPKPIQRWIVKYFYDPPLTMHDMD